MSNGQKLTVDGIFGEETRASVIIFQTQKELTVDGIVGPQTWEALISDATIQLGSEGDAVRAAQYLLREKFGYDEVIVDGLFGSVTEAAIRDFQATYYLTVDGIVGAEETWLALISNQP